METIKNLIDEIKEVKFNSFNYYSFIISDLFEEIENQIIINTFLNNLSSSDKVEEDEIITNMEVEEDEIITNMDASRAGIGNEVANFEEPVEYAYQWGTNELYKIIGNLNETHFKIEKYHKLQYDKHPDKHGYTMSFSKEPLKNPFGEDDEINKYFIKLFDVVLIKSFDFNKKISIYFDDDKTLKYELI
jgi:hypothetical protein